MAQAIVPLAAGLSVLLVQQLRSAHQQRRELERALAEYRELLCPSVERLHALRDALLEQMEAGLQGQPGGLMMLPSFVDVLPTGEERGHCYAIDLGGTNLRVAHVQLGEGRGEVAAAQIREWRLPDEHFDLDRGALLAFVARCTAEVIREHQGAAGAAADGSGGDGDASAGGGARPVVGFCFSFPVEQSALDNGRVLSMTKSFRGSGLLGRDVVAELRRELAALGVDALVPAVMNDTVATLVALRYSEPDTQLGIIVGTGTNCAYAERVSDLAARLPPGYAPRSDRMVVNTEWGDLGGPALPSCQDDLWIDCSSTHPGRSLFEKQISGLFLGELARRLLLRLAEEHRLFGHVGAPGLLERHGALSTADMAAMDGDSSADLAGVAHVLERALQIRGTTRRQRLTVQEVCHLVCTRSARLTAAAIAGVLKRMGHPAGVGAGAAGSGEAQALPRVVVAFDGSVFAKYAQYRERLRAALEEVCGPAGADCISLQLVQDGSVLGAAFLAVAAAQWEAEHGGGASKA